MASKAEWKAKAQTNAEWKRVAKKLKKRGKRLHKMIKVGVKALKDKDIRIAQLTSVLEQQPTKGERTRKNP